MVRNQEKFDQAVSLRKRGFTLQEIARYCDISKSTASLWLKNQAFSTEVTKQNVKRAGVENVKRLQLMNKTRLSEREKKYAEAVKAAETEYKHYKKDPLFMAGLMLYVGEGDKTHRRLIRIANARIEVHKIFLRFAVEYLGVPKTKIHFWLLLYPKHNEEKCMRKWSKELTLPYQQFYKNQVIPGKTKKHTLHFGVGNTIIGSTVLKYKLNRWIELATKDLSK
jgi:transcriptional regulator with XRE-family HTH domain